MRPSEPRKAPNGHSPVIRSQKPLWGKLGGRGGLLMGHVQPVAQLLADVPSNSRPPRIMTGRHPDAAGTLGPEMLAWAADRQLNPKRSDGWRWWQQLAACRALEVDADGQLVWRTVVISGPRQTGKSWLERSTCIWRLDQSRRFGEAQTVLHVAHKLVAATEVWLPAALWARHAPGYTTRFTNGEQQIGREGDLSRWLIQAANPGAGVAFSLSMALVDEAWQVARIVVDAAIEPTLLESASPQLWLVSTAGDSESDLMSMNRAAALAMVDADDPGRTLIIEWSAPPDPDLDIDDPEVWRAASPYWDDQRQQRIADRRSKLDEYTFRQQYLNQWVPTVRQQRAFVDFVRWTDGEDDDGPGGRISFGVDMAPDRDRAAIVACGDRHLEVVKSTGADNPGVGWVAGEVLRLLDRWEGSTVSIDKHGPALTVIDQLRNAGLSPEALEDGGRLRAAEYDDMRIACGDFFDAIEAGHVWHRMHPELDAAVAAARPRRSTGAWIFDRAAGGHVLIAACLSLWADQHQPVETEGWFVA